MADGTIVTFYSYKGGVGRSFALANVGVALAAWGYRVLCVDWDLEAPGLGHYFKLTEPHSGLVDLLSSQRTRAGLSSPPVRPIESDGRSETATPSSDWRDYVTNVEPTPGCRLDLIAAGRRDERYVSTLQELRWEELYEAHGFAQTLEDWRRDWKQQYDFVLIDSRTGITDIGAICTAHLPDLLIVLFTANHQSIDGCVDVIDRAIAARKKIPFDRSALLVLPVPSRFDSKEEYQRAQEWRAIFVAKTGRFLASWLEQGVDTSEVLSRVTVPYVPYWSFGEGLPVVEEVSKGTDSIRFSLETIGALLAHRLGNSALLVETVEGYVQAAIRAGHRVGGYAADLFLSATADFETKARQLAEVLIQRGWRVTLAESRTPSGPEEADRTLDQAQHAAFLLGRELSPRIDAELRRFAKQLIDEQTDRIVLPIRFYPGSTRALPSLLQRSLIDAEPEMTAEGLADLIERELRIVAKRAAPPVADRPEVRLAHSKSKDPNPLVRKAAVGTLGRIGDAKAGQVLIELLEDPDERVRDASKLALLEIKKQEKAGLPGFRFDLQSLVSSSSPLLRLAAVEIRASIGGPQGLYELLPLLDDPDSMIRTKVATTVGAMGNPDAKDWLMAHLEDSERAVRLAVAGALLKIGGLPASTTTEVLLPLLEASPSSEVADALVGVADFSGLTPLLGRLRDYQVGSLFARMLETSNGPRVHEWLLEALKSAAPQSLVDIAGLLVRTRDPRIVETLILRSADRLPEVRAASVEGLRCVAADPEVVKVLISALADRDQRVRSAAVGSLAGIDGRDLFEALTLKEGDVGPSLRAAAIEAVIPRLEEGDSSARSAAARTLAKLAGPLGIERFGADGKDTVPTQLYVALGRALTTRLSDKDRDARNAAARALAVVDGGIEALTSKRDDPSPDVRSAVIEGLTAIGGPQAIAVFVSGLSDRDQRVRMEAVKALQGIGGAGLEHIADAGGIEPLAQILDDSDANVRVSALATLAKLMLSADDQRLLTRDLDGADPWIDPRAPVTPQHVERARARLKLSDAEVRERLAAVGERLGITLVLPPIQQDVEPDAKRKRTRPKHSDEE